MRRSLFNDAIKCGEKMMMPSSFSLTVIISLLTFCFKTTCEPVWNVSMLLLHVGKDPNQKIWASYISFCHSSSVRLRVDGWWCFCSNIKVSRWVSSRGLFLVCCVIWSNFQFGLIFHAQFYTISNNVTHTQHSPLVISTRCTYIDTFDDG